MNEHTKEKIRRAAEEVLVWIIVAVIFVVGFGLWRAVFPEREYAPAPMPAELPDSRPIVTNAVNANEAPPASWPTDGEVISDPGEPQVIAHPDGSLTFFGTASWYDYTFDPGYDFGRPCFKSRERCWTEDKPVAAMRGIPRGRPVTVTNLANGKSVDVTVTDYGPDEELHPGRIIDLSSYAFSQIAGLGEGLVEVKVEWGR